MKKALILSAFIAAALLYASACAGSTENPAADNAGATVLSAPPTSGPAEPNDTFAARTEAAQQTFAPASANTQEPSAAINTPAPPEIPEDDRELLVLVNFENPIYSEPPVELIAERLTAQNVTCDPRRHANARAVTALDEMLLAAQAQGEYHFIIASAFRSIWEQEILWNGRGNKDPSYGSDPHNVPVSVMPKNCSEHTTGLAFDILCDNCPHSDPTYAATAEGRWLMQNSWKYGFILRYPSGKQEITGVQYEPWHYRYVGKAAAKYMHDNGLCLEEFAALINAG